jgi:hypothetical protein
VILVIGLAVLVAALSAPNWPLFVILGVLGTGMSFVLYIVGLTHTSPTAASMVAMIEPVTATLWGRGMASVASTDNRGTTENRRGVWRHRLKAINTKWLKTPRIGTNVLLH